MDSHTILLVEENNDTSKMLKKHLTMGNYKIICIADGQEACRLFDSADFSLGADDFITKPFSVAEVIVRIQANIRRVNQYFNLVSKASAVLSAGDLTMNLSSYTILKNGGKIDLTTKEFEIVKIFLQNPQKVYTKE